MNKYRYILYIICALCTLSCADDKMPIGGTFLDRPYHLSIGKNALSFGASQNLSDNIAITSSEVSWEITGAPDWLTLSATTGTGDAVVTVKASENKDIDKSRTAFLKVSSTTPKYQYSKSIAVSQFAATATISVDKTSLSLAPQAVTESVAVNSNVEWEAVCSSSWITLSKTGDTILQISASENLTGTARTATVNLHRKGFTATLATISVTQSEGGVTGSTEKVAFGVDGGTESVEIDADVAWNASSSVSWLAVTPEEGTAGEAQLKITALANSSANSRNGFVYVKIGSVKKLSIPVSQEGISLKVNSTSLNFAASGKDSQKLSVTANKEEWKVLSSPDWVTVTPAEGGKGTTEVTVKAAENRSLNQRIATFRIGFEGLNVYKDISVAQEGLDSEFGGSTLEFPWEASQKDIEIVVPDSWSAMVSSDWISLSQYSGSGGETVYVMVQTNDNEDARTGTVTLVTEGRTFSFSVVQQGQYLKINSTAGEVAAMGGSVELSITTTVGAKDSIEYEGAASGWLAVSGDSTGKYTLTAVYNPSMNPRVAQFVIKPTMDATNSTCTQGVRFTVTQKGRNLMASTDKVEMFKSGGTSATYTITADGKYSISKPDADNWYVLQHDEEAQSFTLYLSENRTDDTRESQLTISLQELPEGETRQVIIPVTQYARGVNFGVDVDGWDDDQEWDATGTLNGHDWVDMALPSGLKWAICNVGASSPEDYGNYYAWGETSTKSSYNYSNSTTSGKDMSDIGGNATYDVVRNQWGSSWRLPTQAEFEELLDEDNCTWEWSTQSGVNGYKVTSKVNGNSIFLPAAGHRIGTSLNSAGSYGNYWSSMPYESNTYRAYFLCFKGGDRYTGWASRDMGLSVRPVTE